MYVNKAKTEHFKHKDRFTLNISGLRNIYLLYDRNIYINVKCRISAFQWYIICLYYKQLNIFNFIKTILMYHAHIQTA